MKRLIIIFCLLLLATIAWAANPHDNREHYTFGTATGGTDNALDSVDGANLSGGETATIYYNFGTVNYVSWDYVMDADSAQTESGLDFVAPDSNAGDKRWVITKPPIVARDTEPTGLPDGVIWIDTSAP